MSYRASAKAAGFSENHGFRITQMPAVRARIAELGKEELRDRAWFDAQWTRLANRVNESDLDEEERANVTLRMNVLVNHARYKGYIIERRQVATAKVDFSRVSGDKAEQVFAEYLQRLAPGMRKKLEVVMAKSLAAEQDANDANPGSKRP
jgi:hypothetical protein